MSPRRPSPKEGEIVSREPIALLLVHTERGKQLVAMACERAESIGVRSGMTLAHARSLLRDSRVVVESFDPLDDDKSLRRLARWALRFSPVVAPDPPDGLLLNIHGCEHLYGGEEALAKKLLIALRAIGLPARIAIAPTYTGARAVARHGEKQITQVPANKMRDALARLPVTALRFESTTCDTLLEMGVERVGDLLCLPRDQLTARFDASLLKTLDHALGEAPELLEPIETPRTFETAQLFDGPIKDARIIEGVCQRLLHELLRELTPLQRGIAVLNITFRRIALEPERVALKLTHPSGNARHLWKLLAPKLERVHLGHGVEEIGLRADEVGPVREEQFTLWPDVIANSQATQSAALSELLDQLVQRLGERAVTQSEPVETYIPERAFRPVRAPRTRSKSLARIYPAPRPSRIFDSPEAARVIALVPDGPPVWIKRRGSEHDVVTSVGPERLALPWWTAGQTVVRDYYAVQDKRGIWLWVFRSDVTGTWFVHGEWN